MGYVKITIDRLNCVSCGTCWEGCPGFFEQNPDDSFSQVIEKFRNNGNLSEGTPTPDLEGCASQAASDCPASVIFAE